MSPIPDSPIPTSEPRRMEVVEAYALAEAGGALLLDARDRRMYDNAHPKGALSLPAALIESYPDALPAETVPAFSGLLLFYCA